MKIEKLRVGSKVKIIQGDGEYLSVGDIGFLVNDSYFHVDETLTDDTGHYWITIPKKPEYKRYCLGEVSKFKVLKY